MKGLQITKYTEKQKLAHALFYIGLTIELLILLADKSALHNPWEGQLFRVTFLLFVLKVCLTGYSLREWLWIGAFGILGVTVYLCTGENVVLRGVAFAAAIKGMELRSVLKYVLWVTFAGVMLIILLAVAGILGTVSMVGEFRQGLIQNRYSFGMGHPNAAHCMFFMIILLILYLYREKMTDWSFAGLFLANGVFFYFTDSKTGMIGAALAVLTAWILHKFKRLREARWVYLLGMAVFLFCIGVSVWAAKNSIQTWWNPFLMKVDTFFTGRMIDLYWGTETHAGALETWTLFSDPSHLKRYFDMGWVRVFYWFGIIPGGILVTLPVLLIWKCFKKKDYMGLVMIVALSVYTIIEAHIVSVYLARNYMLFLFGAYWNNVTDQRVVFRKRFSCAFCMKILRVAGVKSRFLRFVCIRS